MTNFQSNTTPWINREKLLIGLPAGLGVVLALDPHRLVGVASAAALADSRAGVGAAR